MRHWIWLCPVLAVAVAGGFLVGFGLSLWTIVLAALVLGCPIVAVWAYSTGWLPGDRRDGPPGTTGR